MGIKITGLDEFQRKLDTLQRRAENVSGPVPFDELFPPEFVRRYTDFKSIAEMLRPAGRRLNRPKISSGFLRANGINS
jgi:hypothetical protein